MGAVAGCASRGVRPYFVLGAPALVLAELFGCFPRDELAIHSRDWGTATSNSGGTAATPSDQDTLDAGNPASNDGSAAGAGGSMDGAEMSAGGSSRNGMAPLDAASAPDVEIDAGGLADAGGGVSASLSDGGS